MEKRFRWLLPPWRASRLQSQSTAPGVRMPIQIKITLPYMLLAMVVATAAAYVITKIMFDTVEDRYNNQLIETGKIAAEAMVREEARLLNTLRLIAFTTELPEAVSTQDADWLRDLAYPLAVNRGEEAVEILGARGQRLLAMYHRTGGNAEDYDFTNVDEPGWQTAPFVQQVLAQLVDSQGNKHAGLIQTGRGTYFFVAGPIHDLNHDLVGVVLVGRSVPRLARQMREESLAQITLYPFNGQPLGTTFAETPDLAPALVLDILGRQSQDSYRRSLSQNNIDYIELLGAWQARGGMDLGVVGVALPQTFLVRTTFATRTQILIIIAAALFLIIMVGYMVSSRITQPLLRVVRAATQVASGDLTVQVEENTGDEVAVLARSFNHMIASLQRSQQQIIEAYDLTLEGWSRALDLRDEETEGHTQRTTEMAMRLSRALGVSENDLIHLRRGALLHDIGKMGIPDAILRKPGPLTPAERAIMHQHPEFAYQMLSPIEFLHPALDIPYCHHEWWDGTGYPRQLKGEQIPLAARIFAVVDVWDAMTSNRPYRAALAPDIVRQHVMNGAGSQFDPKVVEAFLDLIGQPESVTSAMGEIGEPSLVQKYPAVVPAAIAMS